MIDTVRPSKTDAESTRVEITGMAGVVARPALLRRLSRATRVTAVSASAGSGKTTLLRSWLSTAGLAEFTAWVPVGRDERDPQRFWLGVVDALRRTAEGSALVGTLTAAPDLDGWTIVERLLTDLAPLQNRHHLVIDDVHELHPDALKQLQLLIMRATPQLRFVLATRYDVPLGLHQLRLEGQLVEIRDPDLRFTLTETEELFTATGLALPKPTVTVLHKRTEGWAAGLRLAALSLAVHTDSDHRRAAEFSGSERTVAEYLLAEVLDRQSEQVRELLLRTSILERVNGELANLLTGGESGERVLQDLEAANAFVVSLDTSRTWFRYHQLFTDLLRMQLRRTYPGEVAALHHAAANWLARRGMAVEAIRHSQAARDWGLAARLLADQWPSLYLDGRTSVIHELLAGFPTDYRVANAELAAVAAADELASGSPTAAERYLCLAEQALASEGQRGHAQLLVHTVRLLIARWQGSLVAVTEQARRLQDTAQTAETAQPGLGEDLRALALISLGSTEFWTARFRESVRHLELGVALARRIRRPYLEFTGLVYQAALEFFRSAPMALEHGRRAAELAEQHGWTEGPAYGLACLNVGTILAWQGRPEEGEPWMQQAERTLRWETEPADALAIRSLRGVLALARGRDADALAAFLAADQVAERLTEPNLMVHGNRSFIVQTLVRLGETHRAEQILADLSDQERDGAQMRLGAAALRLAQDNPQAAVAVLAPVLDGSAQLPWQGWLAQAFLLEAIGRAALGDAHVAAGALERALDLAEPDGVLLWFLLHPISGLLENLPGHRTAHAALIAEILALLAGHQPAASTAEPRQLAEPLSRSELRVLRYLPTNLTTSEIAGQLSVSPNTIKVHVRHLYAKLGAHRRAEAVARARDLGLLAPGSR
ncbi:LuxR C-terminal-related transcriptional regulator [Streptomyces sp. NPDC001185]|uniref:LuxR C-terminal-related transcriptional regulator n=1 Tax=Streptomyces sp. NPDC001185 TaxID=3154380 RepID=UPI00331F0844